MNRIRLTTPAAVIQMAAANHVKPFLGHAAASVELDEVVYFWSAA